jgi:hypothetical protein
MPTLSPLLLLLVAAWGSVAGLLVMLLRLEWELGRAPRLQVPAVLATALPAETGFLRVVIPAYNEATNIADCIAAVQASQDPGLPWQLLVVDDASTDATTALAREALGAERPERQLLQAGPRPDGERWCGKNWPASLGAAQAWPEGDPGRQWLLFLDADVRLEPPALAAAVAEVGQRGSDLLTLAPRLECSCLAEWLVQPIVASLLGLGFPMARSNDPADATAFAAGPFMLFRRSAYEAIGGHRAVAAEVVEDLALARRIKAAGLQLRYLLGVDLVRLQMYSDLAALWEGWTKNWYLGLDRDLIKTLGSGAVVLLLFTAPWALLLIALISGQWALLLPALLAVGLQLALRLWSRWRFGTAIRYWWLAWLGGLLIGAIVPASIWKIQTGRGWTWRGRSLAT